VQLGAALLQYRLAIVADVVFAAAARTSDINNSFAGLLLHYGGTICGGIRDHVVSIIITTFKGRNFHGVRAISALHICRRIAKFALRVEEHGGWT